MNDSTSIDDNDNIDDLLNYTDNISPTETAFSKLQNAAAVVASREAYKLLDKNNSTTPTKKRIVSYGRTNTTNTNKNDEDRNCVSATETYTGTNHTPPSQVLVFDDTPNAIIHDKHTTNTNGIAVGVVEQTKDDTKSSEESLIVSEEESSQEEECGMTIENTPASQRIVCDEDEDEDEDGGTQEIEYESELEYEEKEENESKDTLPEREKEGNGDGVTPSSQMLVRDEVENGETSEEECAPSPTLVSDDATPTSLPNPQSPAPIEEDDTNEKEREEASPLVAADEDAKDESSKKEAEDSAEISRDKETHPSDELVLEETERIFQTSDRNCVTVGDIIRTLESKHGIAFETRVKIMIRGRLVHLVSQDDPDSDSDSSSSSRNSSEDEDDSTSSTNTPIKNPKRNKSKRKRILQESKLSTQKERVRMEELEELQPSKEDEKVMLAIAERFRTDTEEIQKKRRDGFQSLLSKLHQKKKEAFMEIIPTTTSMMELSKDCEDEEGESSEDELEIVMDGTSIPRPTATAPPALNEKSPPTQPRCFSSREALKEALKAKKRMAGNAWLARELGYSDEKEHLLDCRRTEVQRRKVGMREEEEKRMLLLRAKEREEEEEDDVVEEEEEDEELLLAKQVVQEQNYGNGNEEHNAASLDHTSESDDEMVQDNADSSTMPSNAHAPSPAKLSDRSASQESFPPCKEDAITNEVEDDATSQFNGSPLESQEDDSLILTTRSSSSNLPSFEPNKQIDYPPSPETTTTTNEKPRPPKNAKWKALLEQDSKRKIRKSSLIEAEAEESEEEAIAGLEDFGFQVKSKQKDDDDDDLPDDLDDDDFSNVVDDLSDNEGDEEAGRIARTRQHKEEEKERHEQIIRRMRDGYDGRRGNVASSLHSRGKHRLDQLVSADNRQQAKKLGLLNDDELEDSDDEADGAEKEKHDNEEDDEAVLLDKMLKERYLPNNLPDEDDILQGISDDEEEHEQEGEGGDDDPDKESSKIAKRFTKQAVMNRLIEEYGDDLNEEFSQTNLMEEDETIRMELKSMKTIHSLKRHSSISTTTTSFSQSSDMMNTTTSNTFFNNNSNSNSNSQPSTTSLFSLAVSSHKKKRKGTFLSANSTISHYKDKKRKTSTVGTNVTSSHVVFHNTNSLSGTTMSAPSSHMTKEADGSSKLQGFSTTTPKRSTSTSTTSSSLWSRVSANRFRKP